MSGPSHPAGDRPIPVAGGAGLARLVHRGVAIGSVALGSVVITFLLLYAAHRSANAWVEHSRHVDRLARETRMLSLDRETGVRGFLLSGDSASLAPDLAARGPLLARLDSLRRLTADDPVQLRRVAGVADALARWETTFAIPALAARLDGNTTEADRLVGKAQFDDLRARLGELVESEGVLYARRRERGDQLQRWALLAVVLEVALVFVALRGLGSGIERQAREIDAQQQQLEEQAIELEAQTDEARAVARTLETANVALAESEARYRAFVDAAPQLAWSASPDGTPTFFNARWAEYTGVDLRAALGGGWMRFVHPDDRERAYQARVTCTTTEAPHDLELRLRRRDGVHRWFASRIVPLRDDGGAVVAWYCASLDIDERRRAEEALGQANRELAATAYTIAHDLRSPLRAIDGYSRILELDHSARLGPDALSLLSRLRANSQRMGQLIDGVLSLARLGRGELECSGVDLGTVARQVAEELRRAEPGRVVQLTVTDGLVVDADARLMSILLHNLLGNAWKFTRRNAEEGRPPACVELGSLPAGSVEPPASSDAVSRRDMESTIFFVRDNGAGFDPAHAHRLFGAFQRLHHEDQYDGHGIGLATVRRVVERHAGRAWATGSLDGGATVYFTIAPDGCRSASAGGEPSSAARNGT